MRKFLQWGALAFLLVGGFIGLSNMIGASLAMFRADGISDDEVARLTLGINQLIEFGVIACAMFFSAYIKFKWPTYRVKPDPTIEAILDERKARREAAKRGEQHAHT